MPLRGIANDAGEYVELTADGLVAVSVYAEQHVGADLARALEHEGHERFTGVLFGSGESFSDLDLYLTCALPGGMSRLSATGPAVASSVVRPQFNWGAMCTVDGDSLAYLTLRQPEYEDSRVGSWEAGVVGHGPHGAALADEVAAHIRTWGAELRGAPAVLRIAQGDGRERLTGRCVVDKEFSRIAVDWIA
jgi:protein-L-isoaspartate(D-aspartate) O-methyltransferase